ncbi:MAG: hypothetical protein IBX41_08095 [Methanophagales archaeon]|nr:hypothetical protein [Methanophagales archaeon]
MVSAVTSKTPLVIKEPNSPAAKAIKEVVKGIAKKEEEGEIKEGENKGVEEEKKKGRKLFGRKE